MKHKVPNFLKTKFCVLTPYVFFEIKNIYFFGKITTMNTCLDIQLKQKKKKQNNLNKYNFKISNILRH